VISLHTWSRKANWKMKAGKAGAERAAQAKFLVRTHLPRVLLLLLTAFLFPKTHMALLPVP
jgi:hypothetical protein